MTPEAARWVYDVVLTQRFKEAVGAIMWTGAGVNRRDEGRGMAFLATCPCQDGLCGTCGDGRACSHLAWTPPFMPETWVQAPSGAARTPVWRAGKPCAWLCPSVRLGQLELVPAGVA